MFNKGHVDFKNMQIHRTEGYQRNSVEFHIKRPLQPSAHIMNGSEDKDVNAGLLLSYKINNVPH